MKVKSNIKRTSKNYNISNKVRIGEAGKNYSLTPYGIAYKGRVFINGKIQKFDGIPIDILCAIPVKKVEKGDVIEFTPNRPFYITKAGADGSYEGVSFIDGTSISYIPKTYFDLKIYTKISLVFDFGMYYAITSGCTAPIIMSVLNSYDNCNENKMSLMMRLMGGHGPFANMFNLNNKDTK